MQRQMQVNSATSGVSAPYEPPSEADLVLPTDELPVGDVWTPSSNSSRPKVFWGE